MEQIDYLGIYVFPPKGKKYRVRDFKICDGICEFKFWEL